MPLWRTRPAARPPDPGGPAEARARRAAPRGGRGGSRPQPRVRAQGVRPGSRSPQIMSVGTASRRRSSRLSRMLVRKPRREISARSSARLAWVATGSRAPATRESSRSGCRTMVSASPTEAIILSIIRRPGFTARTMRSPTPGVAASRSGRGARPPGRFGTEPSMTSPRTRSGWARANQVAQIPPPEAPTRTRDVEAQGVQHVADEVDGVLAEVSRPEGVRIAEAAAGSVDEVGPGAGHPAREHQVGQGRGVGAVQVHQRGPSPAVTTWTRRPDGRGTNRPCAPAARSIRRYTSSIAGVCRVAPRHCGGCSCTHDPSRRRASPSSAFEPLVGDSGWWARTSSPATAPSPRPSSTSATGGACSSCASSGCSDRWASTS